MCVCTHTFNTILQSPFGHQMTPAKQYVDELSVNETEPCGLNFLQNTLGFKMRERYLKEKKYILGLLNLNHLEK